ncbi:MAG: hypothetical protein HQK76_06830 [Desulfobacterales bacterium]|nr:hypothetical protein [Desulfobacterales bacterium]
MKKTIISIICLLWLCCDIYYSFANGLESALREISQDFEMHIIKNLNTEKSINIVINSFLDGNTDKPTIFSTHIEDGLMDVLIDRFSGQDKIKILERKRLEDIEKLIYEEAQGEHTHFEVDQWREKLGKKLGAGFLITGNFFKGSKNIKINAKMINIISGVVVATSSESIPLDELDAALFIEKQDKSKMKGQLNIKTVPENSHIKFLNMEINFFQGIELAPGQYQVEVSSYGFETDTINFLLEPLEKKKILITLKPHRSDDKFGVLILIDENTGGRLAQFCETEIKKKLLSLNIPVVDSSTVISFYQNTDIIKKANSGSKDAAISIGRQFGARFLISGSLATSMNPPFYNMKSAHADIFLQVVDCSSEKYIFTDTLSQNAVHISDDSAKAEAAKKLIQIILEDAPSSMLGNMLKFYR